MLTPPLPLTSDAELRISIKASVTTNVTVQALISRNKREPPIPVRYEPIAHTTGDRTNEETDFEIAGGFLHGISVFGAGDRGTKRVAVAVGRRGLFFSLCEGYVYDSHGLDDGEFTEPGPGGGEGFLSWVPAFTRDRAGNGAAVDFDLFATNALRKIYGVAWYYHCSGDVANRTFVQPLLAGLSGTKPTGFTLTGANALFWNLGGDIALVADEEALFMSKNDRTARVDNGVMTVVDTSTDPTPWPLWVTEDDIDTILRFPAITNGEALDRHSAYVLMEEWLII